MTYEYDEIITAKDILAGKVNEKDVIGKKGWLLDCIPRDMSLNTIARLGVHVCLTEIDLDSASPFGDGGIPFTYFLPEKEESAAEPVTEKTEKKSYEERQAEWIEANGIKIGDKVRVRRKAGSYENGWTNTWASDMDEAIGNIRVVSEFYATGIGLDDPAYYRYPYFVLEKVKDEPAYIPFDLSDPKDRDFLRGKWIKRKDNGEEVQISFFAKGLIVHDGWTADAWSANNCSSEYLLDEYTFLDGSPIGRRKEEA